MKISSTRFVLFFIVGAFVFQFISNSILSSEVSLFPENGNLLSGSDSRIDWKKSLATILYPIKFVLLRPLTSFFTGSIETPVVMLLAYTLYWASIAFVFHYLLCKINILKKS